MAGEQRRRTRKKRTPKQIARTLTIEVRRQKAFELKRDGWTYREIAKRLGVSVAIIHRDINDLLDELTETTQELAKKERAAQLGRLDVVVKVLMPKVRKGDYDAIHRLERIEKRRAELLGLDAPTKVQTQHSLGDVTLDDIDELRKAAAANADQPAAPEPSETLPGS